MIFAHDMEDNMWGSEYNVREDNIETTGVHTGGVKNWSLYLARQHLVTCHAGMTNETVGTSPAWKFVI